MTKFAEGVTAEQNRIIAVLEQYEITKLLGGAILLTPIVEKEDQSWKGVTHKTGSLSSYFRRGCRCDTCKSFVSEYQKHRRTIRKGK